MVKNILVTGANGQLGREIKSILFGDNRFNPFFTDVAELDITDCHAVNCFVKDNKIDIIINCAAYTAVDKAEDDIDICAKINITAVRNIAKVAIINGAKIIHISTDYVFDGYNFHPYTETDITAPKSVYGTTKLEGEQILRAIAPDSITIRTSWLYSPHGNNFVKTMIRLGREKEMLNVVCDQIGTPTSATDLATAIVTIIAADCHKSGIFHFSNEGAISWYDFAKSIHRIAKIDNCIINPILSKDYPTKAVRPFYSVLDKSKIKNSYGITIPYWEKSLIKCIKILENDNK